MTPDQRRRWKSDYHIDTEIDGLLADPRRSIVVLSTSGCGLTTSLSLLSDYSLLAFPYAPDQWPGKPQAFTEAADHFSQWMAYAAHVLMEEIEAKPECAMQIAPESHEFLIWLVYRYLGRRQRMLWVQRLQPLLAQDTWEQVQAQADARSDVEPLYGDSVSGLYGQIRECLTIANVLGWRGMYASIDVSWHDWISRSPTERSWMLGEIKRLLTTLTPLQVPNFGIKMGLPHQMASLQDVQTWVRGRAVVSEYRWDAQTLEGLMARMIKSDNPNAAPAPDLTLIWQTMHIHLQSIWERLGPKAVSTLARIVLESQRRDISPPTVRELCKQLYKYEAKLRLDHDKNQHLIWRGMTPITLDETPYRFFERLWNRRGHPVGNEELDELAGSRANLDKNISRIREAIEPLFRQKEYLYIQRSNSQGTWLVAEMCATD